jgi:NitT/TauT family transport system substrate-binding protein
MSAANVAGAVETSLEMARMGGLKDIVPVAEIISTQFKPVPTKP